MNIGTASIDDNGSNNRADGYVTVDDEGDVDSCFVTHLSHYMSLTDGEKSVIADLEMSETAFDTNDNVYSRGDSTRALYIVKKGWLYSSSDLSDGRRHILQIHHPGDIIGVQNVAYSNTTSDLTTLEPCVLCPFQRVSLGTLIESHPRLAALFIAITAREQVLASDLKRATARLSAADRILFLAVMLLNRLRITNTHMSDTMRFPLTQTHVGDMVGLTNVSVSKSFGELEAGGLVTRGPATLTVHETRSMLQRLDIEDRFTTINTRWFPAPRD